jgi:hypothetical protein
MANLSTSARNDAPYRGLIHTITGSTGIDEMLDKAGLSWKTVPMPMGIIGRTETRPSFFRALVRSDDGMELGVASPAYKPIHNRQLLEAAVALSGEHSLKLIRAGAIDGGRRVAIVADLGDQFEVPLPDWMGSFRPRNGHEIMPEGPDTTGCHLTITSGHVPGIAAEYGIQAWRQWCSNGARIERRLGRVRITHRGDQFAMEIYKLAEVLDRARGKFQAYGNTMKTLSRIKLQPHQTKAYILSTTQPDVWAGVMEKTLARIGTVDVDLWQAAAERLVADPRAITDLYDRTTELCLAALEVQPGAAIWRNTLYGAYNAITWVIDHVRGRSVDASVGNALFGTGALLKDAALDRALELVPVLAGKQGVS